MVGKRNHHPETPRYLFILSILAISSDPQSVCQTYCYNTYYFYCESENRDEKRDSLVPILSLVSNRNETP